MKASIRVQSLSLGGSGKTLVAAERHGKRQDSTSQRRRVRDDEPLVWGTLDLRDAYEKHVEGCKTNKSLKRPVLHGLLQFPTEIEPTEKNLQNFLKAAVKFINETHGGDAVFAARLDRDEKGRHSVDVFFAPKYLKVTKQHGPELWVSPTKHGKELCEKHRAEIERRHNGKFNHGPRQVGIALNSEFRDFLKKLGAKLDPKREKTSKEEDRVEPEVHGANQDKKRLKGKILALQDQISGLEEDKTKLEKEAQNREKFIEQLEEYATGLEKWNNRLQSTIAAIVPYLAKPLTFFPKKIQDVFIHVEDQILDSSKIPENPKNDDDGEPPSFRM